MRVDCMLRPVEECYVNYGRLYFPSCRRLCKL